MSKSSHLHKSVPYQNCKPTGTCKEERGGGQTIHDLSGGSCLVTTNPSQLTGVPFRQFLLSYLLLSVKLGRHDMATKRGRPLSDECRILRSEALCDIDSLCENEFRKIQTEVERYLQYSSFPSTSYRINQFMN